MKERRFYKIKKKDNTFIVTLSGNIVFESNAKHVRQCGMALITTNTNGKHDLYLPVTKIEDYSLYIEKKEKCLPVLKNFCSYQAIDDILLLRTEECCLFIKPTSFSLFLSSPGLLQERIQNIPLVPMKKSAYFVPKSKKSNRYICHIDDSNYTVESIDFRLSSGVTQLLVLPQF